MPKCSSLAEGLAKLPEQQLGLLHREEHLDFGGASREEEKNGQKNLEAAKRRAHAAKRPPGRLWKEELATGGEAGIFADVRCADPDAQTIKIWPVWDLPVPRSNRKQTRRIVL